MNEYSDTVVKPSRRERERARHRRELLAAAETLFADRGYHNTSVEQIASAAEYGTGTVYLYFKSKEALYASLFCEKIEKMIEVVKADGSSEDDPVATLQRCIRSQIDFYDRERAFFRVFVQERMDLNRKDSGEAWDSVCEAYQRFQGYIADIVAEGQRRGLLRSGEPRLYALSLLGIVRMLTLVCLKEEPEWELSQQAEFVMELFLKGAQK